jgi:hypothetical protein
LALRDIRLVSRHLRLRGRSLHETLSDVGEHVEPFGFLVQVHRGQARACEFDASVALADALEARPHSQRQFGAVHAAHLTRPREVLQAGTDDQRWALGCRVDIGLQRSTPQRAPLQLRVGG